MPAESNSRPPFRGVVALDGPSGTGKSTVARHLAERLGAQYLDTGAMYRAVTVAVLDAGIDPSDAQAVAALAGSIAISVSTDPTHQATALNGRPVDREIRSEATTRAVSAVSAVAQVRAVLVELQRQLISAGPTVAEGRDVGSVVWPQAELKVYLTASEDVRARRRAGQLTGVSQSAVAADLRRRDTFDSSRAHSPLTRPDGAVEVDTSALGIEEVVSLLVDLAQNSVSVAHGR